MDYFRLIDECYHYSYVFLGFTKDGQRLISYSCNISTNQSTGFAPVYRYTLYWWNFNLNQPLTKVCLPLTKNWYF